MQIDWKIEENGSQPISAAKQSVEEFSSNWKFYACGIKCQYLIRACYYLFLWNYEKSHAICRWIRIFVELIAAFDDELICSNHRAV
jgi:hypothetical protein